MKRILYAKATKLLAALLCVACITLGVVTAMSGVILFCEEPYQLYGFEPDFQESAHVYALLRSPEAAIERAYLAYCNHLRLTAGKPTTNPPTETETPPPLEEPDTEIPPFLREPSPPQGFDAHEFGEFMEKYLPDMYYGECVLYFVSWAGNVYTNCGSVDGSEMSGYEMFFEMLWHAEEEAVTIHTSQSRDKGTALYDMHLPEDLTVAVAVDPAYAREARATWEKQETIVLGYIARASGLVLLAAALLIYLIFVCGKRADGSVRTIWLDRVWVELQLGLTTAAAMGAVCVMIFLTEEHLDRYFSKDLLFVVITGLSAAVSALLVSTVLSFARNMRGRRFCSCSLILTLACLLLRGLRWLFCLLGRGLQILSAALSRRSSVIFIVGLIVYSVLLALFTVLAFARDAGLFFALLAILHLGFGCFVVAMRAVDLDGIRAGVSRVRVGEVTHQIPAPRSEDLRGLAEDINGIAGGLDEAVAARVKAERLKTELVTNISHDLKTPLTSIISYTELLAHMEGLPEEAEDYIRIIAKKSSRLEALTRDLFDISKAQSGNEEIILERLDVGLLLEQAGAEHEQELRGAGLTLCVDAPKQLYIMADGRKMSRVLGNLMSNALKYAMKGTRVFLNARTEGDEVVLECKNIASYLMDFKGDEIIGRFVRGEESRTTEGNGLGLAIVRSYVTLCGGRFAVVVDGDLFKAIMRFPRCPIGREQPGEA